MRMSGFSAGPTSVIGMVFERVRSDEKEMF